jgi:hypothetical protein
LAWLRPGADAIPQLEPQPHHSAPREARINNVLRNYSAVNKERLHRAQQPLGTA